MTRFIIYLDSTLKSYYLFLAELPFFAAQRKKTPLKIKFPYMQGKINLKMKCEENWEGGGGGRDWWPERVGLNSGRERTGQRGSDREKRD